MKEFTYVLKDENGIHARPAGLLVKEAAKFASKVTVQKGEKSADGKRLFALMGLGAKKGDELKILVEGADEEDAAAALESFLEGNL